MEMTRLTSVSGASLYLNLANVVAIEDFDTNKHYVPHYNPNGIHTGANTMSTARTAIYLEGGQPPFFVLESLAEVCALLEGRDPHPAKILFNNRGKV